MSVLLDHVAEIEAKVDVVLREEFGEDAKEAMRALCATIRKLVEVGGRLGQDGNTTWQTIQAARKEWRELMEKGLE